MPNRFTKNIDLVPAISGENPVMPFCATFDALFGGWEASDKQKQAWQFLRQAIEEWEAETLFWCFIAELSDQDLEECFPEIFPPSTKEL